MEQRAQHSFDIGEAIQAGWQRLWPNIGPMALFAVVVWAVNFVVQIFQRDAGWLSGFLISLIAFVVSSLIAIGWIKIALDITDGRPVTTDGVTERFSLIGPYLIAAVLYAVMVGIGFVLLVVPGIILGIIFMFYGFHIVDTGDRDPIGALRRSAELTRGQRGRLFLFLVLLLLMNILGLLVLVVGVLISSAISLLAVAHVYRRLSPVPPAGPAAGAGGWG